MKVTAKEIEENTIQAQVRVSDTAKSTSSRQAEQETSGRPASEGPSQVQVQAKGRPLKRGWAMAMANINALHQKEARTSDQKDDNDDIR